MKQTNWTLGELKQKMDSRVQPIRFSACQKQLPQIPVTIEHSPQSHYSVSKKTRTRIKVSRLKSSADPPKSFPGGDVPWTHTEPSWIQHLLEPMSHRGFFNQWRQLWLSSRKWRYPQCFPLSVTGNCRDSKGTVWGHCLCLLVCYFMVKALKCSKAQIRLFMWWHLYHPWLSVILNQRKRWGWVGVSPYAK